MLSCSLCPMILCNEHSTIVITSIYLCTSSQYNFPFLWFLFFNCFWPLFSASFSFSTQTPISHRLKFWNKWRFNWWRWWWDTVIRLSNIICVSGAHGCAEVMPDSWIEEENTFAFGGVPNSASDVTSCQSSCINDISCTAVDWSPLAPAGNVISLNCV